MVKASSTPFFSCDAGINVPRPFRDAFFRICQVLILLTLTLDIFAQPLNTDSLKQLLHSGTKTDQIRILNHLVLAYGTTHPDSAISYATRALHLAFETNRETDIIASQYQLGKVYAQKKDTLALRHLESGLERSRAGGHDDLVARGHLEFASYYLRFNAPRQAITSANEALDLTKEGSGTSKLRADAYMRLGAAYAALGLFRNAVESYLAALRLVEVLKDDLETAKIFIAIGRVYQRTGDFEDAIDYFDRALKINKAHNQLDGIVSSLLNKGVIHQKKGKYEDALEIYFEVLPMMRTLKDLAGEAIVTGNIGSTRMEQGKLEEALPYLNKALELKKQVKNVNSTLHTLVDISELKVRLGDGSGARKIAAEVVRLAAQHEIADYLRYGYLNLSNSYELLHDYRNAHHYLKKYNNLNDSLFDIEKAQQINELQIAYDTERKDMAIRSLQQDQEIVKARRKVYILTGTVLLLVLGGLYINQRIKTRRHRELLEKEREVDRLKSGFFANISHEFRTPLSLILGPIDTMLGKTDDAGHRFQLELMKKNAARLLRLINQILDLSKLQFGKQELKVAQHDGVEIVKGVTSTFQTFAETKGIVLEFESDAPEILLFCNQEQLETICINLISNAFKFSDTGGKITVWLNCVDVLSATHAGGAMELRVTDNGIGIPKEHVDHIFDRFYRAGSASEKQYGGTGIGLALTRELVELHHGSITVASELDQGTTVTVRLPLGREHLRADQVTEAESGRRTSLQPDFDYPVSRHTLQADEQLKEAAQKPLVLLMDDNEDVRKYIRSILEENHNLLEASNGDEGFGLAKAFIPDIIISDVMMPVMNGYDACRKLKRDEKTSHIPVILLTAKASINSRIEGLETEADLYLSKPFVPHELILCIQNLIQSRRKLRERYNRQVVLKPGDIAINSTDELFLQRLMKILEENYADEDFSVEQLSEEIGMSRSQLHRKLHALTNESCSQFIRSFRLQRAMEMLKKNHGSVSEIAFLVGFSSHPYFNRCFLQHYGCTPSSVMEKTPV